MEGIWLAKGAQESCRSCEWNEHCSYGCRIEAMAQGHGLEGTDDRICMFFREGYYERFRGIAHRFGLACSTA